MGQALWTVERGARGPGKCRGRGEGPSTVWCQWKTRRWGWLGIQGNGRERLERWERWTSHQVVGGTWVLFCVWLRGHMLIPGSLLRWTTCNLDGLRSELSRGQQWFSRETPGAASRKGNRLQMAELVRSLQRPLSLLSRVTSRNPRDAHPSLHTVYRHTGGAGAGDTRLALPSPHTSASGLLWSVRGLQTSALDQIQLQRLFLSSPWAKEVFTLHTHTHTHTHTHKNMWQRPHLTCKP